MADEQVVYTPAQDANIAETVNRVMGGARVPPRGRTALAGGGGNPEFYEGKPASDIPKGEWGALTVWSGAPGGESETSLTIDVFNRYGDVTAGTWCAACWFNGAWRLILTECPET